MPVPKQGGSLADLKEQNLSRILSSVAQAGTITREEIRRSLGVQASSLSRYVDELRARGLLSESESIHLVPIGRPTQPIVFARDRWALLGLIVDRHEIHAAVSYLDLTVITTRRFPVPDSTRVSGHATALAAVAAWATGIAEQHGLTLLAAEIDAPGALNRDTGDVYRSLLNGWGTFNLADTLQPALTHQGGADARPVAIRIDRDTNAAMQARLRDLDAAPDGDAVAELHGPSAYFGGRYALSGGIFDGGVVRGATGLAGDFGHLAVDPHGEVCWCDRTGCLETKAGLAALHRARFGRSTPIHDLSAEGPLLLAELQASRDEGDSATLAVLADAGRWIANSIDTIAAIANPARIVIDGYLAQLGAPLVPTIVTQLEATRSLPPFQRIEVVATDGDPEVPLRGALLSALLTVVETPGLAVRG